MIRLTTILWLAVVACTGVGMFKVKYQVQELEEALARVKKEIVADQDAIHVLNAEWAFLNQPTRLADLAQKFLQLQPIATAQLAQMSRIETLRMKPTAAGEAIVAAPAAAPTPAAKPTRPLAGTAVASVRRTDR
jgi:cell division protein FtsL